MLPTGYEVGINFLRAREHRVGIATSSKTADSSWGFVPMAIVEVVVTKPRSGSDTRRERSRQGRVLA